MTRQTFYKKIQQIGFKKEKGEQMVFIYSLWSEDLKRPYQKRLVLFTNREAYIEGEERAVLHNWDNDLTNIGLFDDTRLPYSLMIKFLEFCIPFIEEHRRFYDN